MFAISLISDRLYNDFFLGRLKGQILKDCPGVAIVDIAHNVGTHNINKAGFILKNSYKHFPDNTIHLIGIDSESGINQNHIIVYADNQYFIGADNGIFSLIFEHDIIYQIYRIYDNNTENIKIPALFSFVKTAKQIINGKELSEIGEKINFFKRKIPTRPTYDADYIIGNIIHIDSYQNAISNISKSMFENVGKGRRFKILAGSTGNIIDKINLTYQESEHGEILALFNSMGLLEIAINRGKVSTIMSFNNNTNIRIDFY